jgi:hypothetical protein
VTVTSVTGSSSVITQARNTSPEAEPGIMESSVAAGH